jgi:undecaprenyl-diphosphatase
MSGSAADIGGTSAGDVWPRRGPDGLLGELQRLDLAIYSAVAASPTPSLDGFLRRLSHAADHSKISFSVAAGLALAGGPRGRRAALRGVASIAVTSAVINAVVKPLARRRRPDRVAAAVPESRHVKMPESHSFASGHSAAAFAFAAGVGRNLPWAAPPLTVLAFLVAYSRVHTGVHYPGDVVFGSLCGVALAEVTSQFSARVLAD